MSSPVLQVGPLMPDLEAALSERYDATVLRHRDDPLPDGAAEHVRVAVTSGRTGVSCSLMEALPHLGAIANFGVGYDTTDVDTAAARGVVVANTPDVLTDCVADTAVGLVIDVMRRLSAADRYVRAGSWPAEGPFPLTRRVSGARVGILGLGRIGLATATRLAAFGARIGYHNRRRRDDVEHRWYESAEALARHSDVLVITAAGGPASQGIVDAQVLDALGPQGFLVNVARGSVVDEAELVRALDAGRIAGAGLDCYADEPHVPEALLDRSDVVLLPHLASGTVETRGDMAALVLENVAAFLGEGRVLTPVPG
jgi:lactate dehydrogenase-like 2-hydroxyacid dehydrogenase